MKLRTTLIVAGVLFLALAPTAFASSTGTPLPWEKPLVQIQESISGPVAFVICVLGVLGVFAVLIFGGELTEFTRKAIFVVTAGAAVAGAVPLVTTLFGLSGALV